MDITLKNDRRAAVFFGDLARAAGVRGGNLNAGAWVLGAKLRHGTLDEVLADTKSLHQCIESNLGWFGGVAEHLGKIVTIPRQPGAGRCGRPVETNLG